MALQMQLETRQKLAKVPVRLSDEFPDTPVSEVSRRVEAVARDLIAGARIEDFIPVLVHRYAREQLLDRRHQLATD